MIGLLHRHRVVIALGLLLLAGAIAAQVAADRDRQSKGPALSSESAEPNGALALALWLERLGYRVERDEGSGAVPDADLRFVLRPLRGFDRAEARAMVDWVQRGGVLVYVPTPVLALRPSPIPGGEGLDGQLAFTPRLGAFYDRAAPSLPFFTTPPARDFVVNAAAALDLGNDGWVPLIGEPGGIIAATRAIGRGRVYAVTSEALFANQGIDQGDNAAFVMNLLARHPALRTVVFDEGHHRLVAAPDLLAVVRSTPWGWAILYAAAVTFLFAAWAGRRFGPAVVPERRPGQSGADYITAFAGLLQRARAPGWVQAQYTRLVRQRLAHAHGVRAELPAADLARLVAERRPVDAVELADHLSALDGPPLGEKELLGRARAVEQMLRKQ